jgi:hypothetical protein
LPHLSTSIGVSGGAMQEECPGNKTLFSNSRQKCSSGLLPSKVISNEKASPYLVLCSYHILNMYLHKKLWHILSTWLKNPELAPAKEATNGRQRLTCHQCKIH